MLAEFVKPTPDPLGSRMLENLDGVLSHDDAQVEHRAQFIHQIRKPCDVAEHLVVNIQIRSGEEPRSWKRREIRGISLLVLQLNH